MIKYIVKRLCISVFVLLGVSLIIYTMIRLMPSDYIDNKYSEQLKMGQMDQEDIDNFKKMFYFFFC